MVDKRSTTSIKNAEKAREAKKKKEEESESEPDDDSEDGETEVIERAMENLKLRLEEDMRAAALKTYEEVYKKALKPKMKKMIGKHVKEAPKPEQINTKKTSSFAQMLADFR